MKNFLFSNKAFWFLSFIVFLLTSSSAYSMTRCRADADCSKQFECYRPDANQYGICLFVGCSTDKNCPQNFACYKENPEKNGFCVYPGQNPLICKKEDDTCTSNRECCSNKCRQWANGRFCDPS